MVVEYYAIESYVLDTERAMSPFSQGEPESPPYLPRLRDFHVRPSLEKRSWRTAEVLLSLSRLRRLRMKSTST